MLTILFIIAKYFKIKINFNYFENKKWWHMQIPLEVLFHYGKKSRNHVFFLNWLKSGLSKIVLGLGGLNENWSFNIKIKALVDCLTNLFISKYELSYHVIVVLQDNAKMYQFNTVLITRKHFHLKYWIRNKCIFTWN